MSHRPRRKNAYPAVEAAIAAILIAGFGSAGCGSSDDSSTTSTTALTRSEFLKKGNAICKEQKEEILTAAGEAFPKGTKPSKAQLTEFANDTLIPSRQAQINQIRALGAPARDQAQVNAILNSAQSALDKGKEDPVLLTNPPGPFKKANELAEFYGLKACSG